MKALFRFIGVAFCAILMAGSAFALDVPPLTGRVVDNAKVFSAEQTREIAQMLEELEKTTTAQVVVLTVPSLKGPKDAQPDTPFDFSQRVFDKWQLGQKGKDNGLLILFAIKEKTGRVHTGRGMEGIIPDAERVMLGERLFIPHLPSWRKKEGTDDYYAATKAGLERVIKLIKLEAKAGDMPPDPTKEAPPGLVVFLIAAFIAALVGCAHPGWGGAVGGVSFGLIGWTVALPIGGIALAALIGFIIGLLGIVVINVGGAVFTGGGGGSGGGGFDF